MIAHRDNKTDDVRVRDCLNGYCPKRTDECKKCDGVVAILRRALLNSSVHQYDLES